MNGSRSAALCAAVLLLCACASQPDRVADAQAASATAPGADQLDQFVLRKDLSARLAADVPVVIDNPYGDVRLRFGGYEHQIDLHVTEQQPDGAVALDYHYGTDGERFLIQPRLPAGVTLHAAQRTDLVVFVPLGHAIDVTTVRGLIEGRGVKADIRARSEAGAIQLRGTSGQIDAETAAGGIEVALEDPPAGAVQRLATHTGPVIVAVSETAGLEVDLATSAPFTTEFSLDVTPQPGQEPNKQARAEIGKPQSRLSLSSRRGEIRLLRRAAFTPVTPAVPADPAAPAP